jgi:hypothetical protein
MRKSRECPELAGLREAEWCWAGLLICTHSTAARSSGTSIEYRFRDFIDFLGFMGDVLEANRGTLI